MIRRGVVKGESQKFFKGYSIVNLAFELRVRVDIYPVGPEDRTGWNHF
jgi:hypothetical protein